MKTPIFIRGIIDLFDQVIDKILFCSFKVLDKLGKQRKELQVYVS